jgi:hypothetical protein
LVHAWLRTREQTAVPGLQPRSSPRPALFLNIFAYTAAFLRDSFAFLCGLEPRARVRVIALEIMKAKKQSVNFRGRFEFLEATTRHWPEPLNALLRLKPNLPTFGTTPPPDLSELGTVDGGSELQEAVWSWSERFQIRDAWIRDAAVQTVVANANGEQRGWKYTPPELELGVLEFRIGSWIPPVAERRGQQWPVFKRTAMKVFLTKLERYRKDTERLWGAKQSSLALHAEWAVLWQRGKSPDYIRMWNERIHQRPVSLANIQTRVSEFAKAIGLTLRASRPGRVKV